MGNSISARINHIREQDIEIIDRNGVSWFPQTPVESQRFRSLEEEKTGGSWKRGFQSQLSYE